MKARRLGLLLGLSLASVLGLASVSSAADAPVWNLDIHHNETNFPPGGTGEYWFDVDNVGDVASSGPVSLSITLPSGLTGKASRDPISFVQGSTWSCPGISGASSFTCTTAGPVARHTLNRALIVTVNVAPAASGDRFATTKLEGGGATKAVTAVELTHISSTPATFGIVDGSFKADFFEEDGLAPVRKASSHPDLATFAFDFNTVSRPTPIKPNRKAEIDTIRDLQVDLPPGFLGDPTVLGECTAAELSFGDCPASSQMGRVDLAVFPIGGEHYRPISSGVFNMVHPRGSVADLAFVFASAPVHIRAELDPTNNYAIKTRVSDINESLPPFHQKLTVWGIPAASGHDSERCLVDGSEELDTSSTCPTDQPEKPFLTLPAECEVDNTMRLHHYDSWQNTGTFGPDITYGMPGRLTDCDKPRFEPDLRVVPTGFAANTPTGLNVHITVSQNDNPSAQSTPPVKSTVVTLPEGMALSPSFADGLQGCTPSQIGLGTDAAVACPDSSRIGEVELSSPLLPKALEGSMYLAKQGENPFGSLIAFYLALHDTEERGVLVKVAGKADLDPQTGQITTSFEDLPQFPFEDLTLKFRSGDRAPLINPPSCGKHTIAARMTSYARPDEEVDVSNTYEVNEGPGGTPCANDPALRPFAPTLIGGTLNSLAGAFSPMELRISRSDAEQEISSVEAIAPPGLIASLRGVGRCSEVQIAQAEARSMPGQGAEEIAQPSCPATAQIGALEAAAGAGSSPIYVPGKVYLAGPYKGAPLSGVAVVPAMTGPVDLGVVVVRSPAFVDPRTAQLRILTDRFPQMVNGVLIRVRDVRIHLDRPHFTLNPTNCEPMRIAATLRSTEGATSAAQNRFQVGECGALGFRPKLTLKLTGGSKRGGHPALTGTYRPRSGDANLRGLVLRLPRSAFLDQGHIRTICTRVQFAAKACPPGAIYGFARAYTPLLDSPLEGPVYLRSSSHELPDVVAALHGLIDVEAVASIDSVKGGIRATFTEVPDAPLEKVEVRMQGQKKGLIVNSTDLCRNPHRANASFGAQNGKTLSARPVVKPTCKKERKANHKR